MNQFFDFQSFSSGQTRSGSRGLDVAFSKGGECLGKRAVTDEGGTRARGTVEIGLLPWTVVTNGCFFFFFFFFAQMKQSPFI